MRLMTIPIISHHATSRVGISFIVPGSHRWIPSWTRLGCSVSAHCLGRFTSHSDCPQVPSRPFLSQFPKSSSLSTWTCITQADCKFSQAGPWRPASGGPREGQCCSAQSSEQRPRNNWEALQPTLRGAGGSGVPAAPRALVRAKCWATVSTGKLQWPIGGWCGSQSILIYPSSAIHCLCVLCLSVMGCGEYGRR